MRASHRESNSPVTTSQRRAGKPRTRSYTRHNQAGSPIWPDVETSILAFVEQRERWKKTRWGGIIGSKF